MIKLEIRNFTARTGADAFECTVPFSVFSATGGTGGSVASVSATATVDGRAIENKFIYLRLTDVSGLRSIKVNGSVAYERSVSDVTVNVNVKPYIRVGENLIELIFATLDGGAAPGLFGSAELIFFSGAAIDKVALKQRMDGGSAHIDITLDMLGNSDSVRAVATLVSGAGHVFYGGITRGKGTITVKDPLFWWPKGMGVQNLYKLTVNVYGEMEIEDTAECRVGIRRVEAESGSALISFGGVSMLPMGAVYKTEKRADPSLSQNRQSACITYAAMAAFNTLAISPEDSLPDGSFFDLCDAHGIAVIREVYTSSLERSGELDALARVSHHPSMAVYHLIHDTGNARSLTERLLHISPCIAVRVTDDAPVHPSHPSMPTERVLDKWLSEDERNLFSAAMESEGRDKLINMLISASERFPYASGFSELVYLSQICSAEKIMDGIREARLGRGETGAVYDALSDIDRGVFSSGIDSSATWKALHYYSKEFFAPLVVIPKHIGGGRVEFYVSNERRQSFVGNLEYRIIDNKNKTIYTASEQCVIERGCAKHVVDRDFGEIIASHETEYYLDVCLRDPMGVFSHVTMTFVPEKHFRFLPPDIHAQVVGSDKRFSVTLTADSYAKGVEISFSDRDAVFSSNYVDITSSAPIKISFNIVGGIETAEHLNRTIRIRSLYDVAHGKKYK